MKNLQPQYKAATSSPSSQQLKTQDMLMDKWRGKKKNPERYLETKQMLCKRKKAEW